MPGQFIGVILIVISFILFVYALPQMTEATDSTNPAYSTLSSVGKQSLDITRNILLPVFGLVLLILGLYFAVPRGG
jgi:type II secretory pathway component PulF